MNIESLRFLQPEMLWLSDGLPCLERLRSVLIKNNIPSVLFGSYMRDVVNGVMNPPDIPREIFLTVSFEYIKSSDRLDELYALVYFLKDFGLDYITVTDKGRSGEYNGKPVLLRLQESLYSPQRYKSGRKKLSDTQLEIVHISKFLQFDSRNFTSSVFKSLFYIYYMRNFVGYRTDEPYDWESDARDSAYEGDTSNYWNVY